MKKLYCSIRFPKEAKIEYDKKKEVINNIIKEMKLKKKFSLADTFRFMANKKIYIKNLEVVQFLKNKKKGVRIV